MSAARRWVGAAAGLAVLALAVPLVARVAPAEPPVPGAVGQGGGVLRHPHPSAPLRERWSWAEREAARRGRGGYWIGFRIRRPMQPGEVVIDDTRGFDLTEMGASRTPLARVLEGREVSEPPAPGGRRLKEIGVLFHFTAPGRGAAGVDRIAVRSLSVGMELGGSPVFWLGGADDAESVPLLREMVPRLRGEELQGAGVEAVAIHARSDLVVPFLGSILRGRMADAVRGEAAEGLTHHPGADALAMLVETARRDRSREVQGEAAEAIGELDHPGATAALRGLVLSDLPVEVRREAAEALGERPPAEAAPVLEEVVRSAALTEVHEEAVEALRDLHQRSVERRDGRAAALVAALERVARTHPDARVRAEAAEALGELRGGDASPFDASSHPGVR
ncbi:MAG TPA: HEAT repeat domain-containing protein [Longimicrobiaceae bacterium]|nr:HEAT repeat domain-containing protein [Longimicrobiaceae bacterium]